MFAAFDRLESGERHAPVAQRHEYWVQQVRNQAWPDAARRVLDQAGEVNKPVPLIVDDPRHLQLPGDRRFVCEESVGYATPLSEHAGDTAAHSAHDTVHKPGTS